MDSHLSNVHDHWEASWESLEQYISPLIRSGTVDIGRLLHVLDQNTILDNEVGGVQETFAKQNNLPTDSTGKSLLKLTVMMGRYVAVPRSVQPYAALADAVISEITDGIRYVVELGSGWGRNLFRVYCQTYGNSIHFAACELTEAGRHMTDMIGALDSRMNCTTHPFDYHKPDFPFLTGKPDVVFFTGHSIEQILDLDGLVLDRMLEKTGRCTCVHFEPVGWQRDPELKEMAMKGSGQEDHQYGVEDALLLKNAAKWSIERRYNRNFLSLLDDFETAGKIRIRQVVFDIIGDNPFNPSTMIVWEKA